MKLQYTFTLTIDADPVKLFAQGPDYGEDFKKSASEFADELNDWLNRHPFVEGCKISKEEI